MLVAAVLGLVVNLVAFLMLYGADRENLNIRGALLHVVGDMLGSVAAIIASLTIIMTGWMQIDPLLSVLIGVFVLRNAGFWSRIQHMSCSKAFPSSLMFER